MIKDATVTFVDFAKPSAKVKFHLCQHLQLIFPKISTATHTQSYPSRKIFDITGLMLLSL